MPSWFGILTPYTTTSFELRYVLMRFSTSMVETFSPLPAKRVTDSVTKVEVAEAVAHHQIARVKRALALLEQVRYDLLVALGRVVRVAVELVARTLAYEAHEQTLLVVVAFNAKAVLVENRVHLLVHLYDVVGNHFRYVVYQGHEATRADLAKHVRHVGVALGGRVKLETLYVEPAVELEPHVLAQPVAYSLLDRVHAIERRRRLIHQKATQLAHVDKSGAAVLYALLPEVRRRELLAQHHRGAVYERRAHAYRAAVAVIGGQCHHDDVVGGEARQVEHDVAAEKVPAVLENGGLGHACGATRVNVHQNIFEKEINCNITLF